MQPSTDTESEAERKDEKTPLVANAIDEGTLGIIPMYTILYVLRQQLCGYCF